MAKKSTVLVRLLSSASGFFYVRKKNPKKLLKKLSFRKFDKYQGKHVLFEEAKIK